MSEIGARKRFTVLHRDRHRCVYCGRGAQQVVLQIDHIIPASRGGSNEIENLATACVECNAGKLDLILVWPGEAQVAADGRLAPYADFLDFPCRRERELALIAWIRSSAFEKEPVE